MSARFQRLLATAFLVTAVVAATLCSGADVSKASAKSRPLRPGDATGELVVAYQGGKAPSVRDAVAKGGGRVVRGYSKPGILLVDPGASGSGQLIRSLSKRRDVRYVEESRVVAASWSPNDPEYSFQWNLRRVGAEDAWVVERGETTVTVAVVDSGVDLEHPDLAGRLDTVHDRNILATDPVMSTIADDAYGHGTHVAGIIAAATDNARDVAGLAHGCTILPVRVLDAQGYGDTTGMALGIIHAVDNGAFVINISAGGPQGTRTLEDAIAYATSKGRIVVAAAGNSGASRLDYPAAYPDVVAVGAIGQNGERWPYSSFSSALDLMAPGITSWNLTQPQDSVGIRSLTPGNDTFPNGATGDLYGTSMAAPHVAGAAALVRSAHPTWTASAVLYRLLATAEDIGTMGRDVRTGYGLVRADLALGAGTPPTSTVLEDSLPGRPLIDPSVSGLLSASDDPDDIYAVTLYEGQHLSATLTCASSTRLRLDVYEPGASSVASPPVASAVTTGGPACVAFTVPRTGTYSLRLNAEEGVGAYGLLWERGYFTETLIEASPTCAWGGAALVKGTVSSYGDEGVGLVPVALDAWPTGASGWTRNVAQARTDAFGDFAFKPRPTRRTRYRVRFAGMPGEYASVSETVTVRPRAALSSPAPTTAITRGRDFRVAGSLRPSHRVGARTVKVTAWHKEAGSWVLRHTVYATNLDRSGYTRYIAKMRVTRRGSWKFVAYVPGDMVHAATYSAPKYTFVR